MVPGPFSQPAPAPCGVMVIAQAGCSTGPHPPTAWVPGPLSQILGEGCLASERCMSPLSWERGRG
jgi:hypothetical protein